MKIKIDLMSNIYYFFCDVKKNTCLCLFLSPLLLGCKVIEVAVDVVIIYVVAVVVVVVIVAIVFIRPFSGENMF